MSDRRSFLKLFGVGCVAAPVIGGTVADGVLARIVEPPKLEIIEPPPLVALGPRMLTGFGPYEAHVTIVDKSGTNPSFSFVSDVNISGVEYDNVMDVTTHGDSFRKTIPGLGTHATLKLRVSLPLQVRWHAK